MTLLSDFFEISPYGLDRRQKADRLSEGLSALTRFHYDHCYPYRQILDGLGVNPFSHYNIEALPFIPVRLFKYTDLLSVPQADIVKTMTSSGTTGQRVSKIFLDRQTAANQTKALVKIMSEFLGPRRLPMLIIDTKAVIKDRRLFSARGAGILGFSMLGRDITYALDEEMNLDQAAVEAFLSRHPNEPILLFGFTFMIWAHFYSVLYQKGIRLPLENGILLHGGGWKKLAAQQVDNETYKRELNSVCGLQHIHNYYGMVEQTGSIYIECEYGHLHAPVFSDVLIRRHRDFSLCSTGETGLIQLVSLLPGSYPGHSILTEDVGELIGEDNCPCGRLGKTFLVYGRVKNAEVRGCSDTYGS